MAAGTRGKLKEDLVGIHRNTAWINQHCDRCLSLLGDDHPELIEAFQAIRQINNQLDEFVQGIYGTI